MKTTVEKNNNHAMKLIKKHYVICVALALAVILLGLTSIKATVTNAAAKVSLFWPIDKDNISSYYGERIHPVTGTLSFHNGIDIPAKTGTPVYAAAAGRVIKTGNGTNEGKYVRIEHANGLVTEYLHLSKITVKETDIVKIGSKIGEAGATGRVTGSHLHFGVKNASGKYENPLNYVNSATKASTVLAALTKPIEVKTVGFSSTRFVFFKVADNVQYAETVSYKVYVKENAKTKNPSVLTVDAKTGGCTLSIKPEMVIYATAIRSFDGYTYETKPTTINH